jgi:TolB protein
MTMPIRAGLIAVLTLGLVAPTVISAADEAAVVAQIVTTAPTTPKSTFYVMQADGKGWEKFFQMPQIAAKGSPAFSHDGKYMAFDGWMSDAGEGTSDSRLFVISTERDELWLLGNGAMPTWGPDNTQLACSFYSGGVGIMTIATQEIVTIDRNGWGTQWSPDGKSIAYAVGTELKIYDVKTKQTRTAFNAMGQYTSLSWNGTWSPDSQRFLFLGTTDDNKKDIASIAVFGENADLKKHLEKDSLSAKFAWHPTEPRIVFGKYSPEQKRSQLFEINPNKNDPPKRLEGQDPTLDVMAPAWSPDGKRLYCIGRNKVEAAVKP